MRADGRLPDQLRPARFQRGFTQNPGGSVLFSLGRTMLLCTAMLEDGVPGFLNNSGQGWLTAEYSMLPASTNQRKIRDVHRTHPDGRGVEIQRLIGRSLRAVVDRGAFPNHTLWVDCDVLQADGGTRTAAITGAFVAVHDALRAAEKRGALTHWPLRTSVTAVSVGVVGGQVLVDLDASEDMRADVDMNVVLSGEGEYIELQGTAERGTFAPVALDRMLAKARIGVEGLTALQDQAINS